MSGDVGCFVYKVVDRSGVAVRRAPSTKGEYNKTGRSFEKGDLVSIDLIVVGTSTSNNTVN